MIVCTPTPSKIQTVFRSGFTLGVGGLWDNFVHKKIRKILLGSAGVGIFTSLRNKCKFGLTNQQAGIYAPATEL